VARAKEGSASPRQQLGWALHASAASVADGILARLSEVGAVSDLVDEDLLEAIARTDVEATRVLGRWIATGEEASREEMDRLGQLGLLADRLPLCDLVKAYLAWRDVVGELLDRKVESLGVDAELSAEIKEMIARSCDASMVRMARRFERQRQSLQEQLEHMALHDALTGLPNRRLLADRLEDALRPSHRDDTVAVCFVDLDGFKAVNDAHGHDAGDRLLAVLAHRLQAMIGNSDTAARVGGDEFVIVCGQLEGAAPAAALADQVREAIAEPCAIDGREVRVAASIGVALGRSGDDAAALLADADAAMYLAKKRGGSCHELHTASTPPASAPIEPAENFSDGGRGDLRLLCPGGPAQGRNPSLAAPG
jgi:diguanylate cyclase (GGDEF)-like protein